MTTSTTAARDRTRNTARRVQAKLMRERGGHASDSTGRVMPEWMTGPWGLQVEAEARRRLKGILQGAGRRR